MTNQPRLDVTIRPFRKADAAALATLVRRNILEVNTRDYPLEAMEKLAAGFTPERFVALSRQREMFVAEVNGLAVGTAGLARDKRTSDEQYIALTVFVHPDFHGRGVGSRLMDAVESAARAKGARVLRLPAGLTGLEFYRRRGYVEDPAFPARSPCDPIGMIKPL